MPERSPAHAHEVPRLAVALVQQLQRANASELEIPVHAQGTVYTVAVTARPSEEIDRKGSFHPYDYLE